MKCVINQIMHIDTLFGLCYSSCGTGKKVSFINTVLCQDSKAFQSVLDQLSSGDCIQIDSLFSVAETTDQLISCLLKLQERGGDLISDKDGIDTRSGQGAAFFALCQVLHELEGAQLPARKRDGIEKAQAEGRHKGRRPIAVDEALFDAVVARWKNGEISARQAMAELELKPNTFYRRIKEMEEQKMKDYKKVQHEIRSEIKAASKKSRQELDELKKQVHAEAKEVKRAAGEKLELHDVEREIRRGRIHAEAEHYDTVRQMKKNVESETKELKKLLKESEDPSPAEESK